MLELHTDVSLEIVQATRMLVNEGVMDAFGHVSVRGPNDPGKYLMSRACAPNLITPQDILEFTLESDPVQPNKAQLFAERVIHGEIYKRRPDVMAIVHCHPTPLLPYCISGVPLVPVFLMGATIGPHVPFWDQQDEFGDTTLLVVKPEEGRSLAHTLGENSVVLMKRHGATIVGANLKDLVFRAVYACRNAEAQSSAHALGGVTALSPGETERAGALCARSGGFSSRTWDFWQYQLELAGNGIG
ncbi:class II aldolase/adducin family protein [Agrobacterium vitis]|uniref:class II aldolase/adducin family protein n=1 Tax=Rhizobium/Agrobacterium group TaxID=227290 RepID=UPI0012E7844C|nr:MULTISPECIES: class II aldolase/adducin family protein [Rhizobium/Agrobacterium group]MCF1494360.1 class II aldolase/adducin family protein [Allorhizobium ampelinum]MUZ66109.1 class II aldolase/adducin family protein [Agrobacterium vitis]MVA45866.1 class II aldolase/adducin family protein [Agrobacterium vitis]